MCRCGNVCACVCVHVCAFVCVHVYVCGIMLKMCICFTYRRQGQSDQALLSFVCEEAVSSFDVHQTDNVSEGGGRGEGNVSEGGGRGEGN